MLGVNHYWCQLDLLLSLPAEVESGKLFLLHQKLFLSVESVHPCQPGSVRRGPSQSQLQRRPMMVIVGVSLQDGTTPH